jgi:hypothetical protein
MTGHIGCGRSRSLHAPNATRAMGPATLSDEAAATRASASSAQQAEPHAMRLRNSSRRAHGAVCSGAAATPVRLGARLEGVVVARAAMEGVAFVAIASLTLLVEGLLGVWLALCVDSRLLIAGEALASGVFLSAGLVHLLPEADELYAGAAGGGGFPVVFLCAALGFLAVHLANFVVHSLHGHADHDHGHAHVAVVDERSPINPKRHAPHGSTDSSGGGGRHRTLRLTLLGAFTLTTPLGVLVGALVSRMGSSSEEAVLEGVAAGSFVYIASEQMRNTLSSSRFSSVEHELSEIRAVVRASRVQAGVLLAMLSLHAFLEGLALGVQSSFSEGAFIFIAILLHKLFEALSIGIAMRKAFPSDADGGAAAVAAPDGDLASERSLSVAEVESSRLRPRGDIDDSARPADGHAQQQAQPQPQPPLNADGEEASGATERRGLGRPYLKAPTAEPRSAAEVPCTPSHHHRHHGHWSARELALVALSLGGFGAMTVLSIWV